MPKPLVEWLHYQALQWQMSGVAHEIHHGRTWHRGEELPGWADCGTWLSEAFVSRSAGKGQAKRNPWDGQGAIGWRSLCRKCFAEELSLLEALERK
jgi:hypothetical protein